MRNVLWIFTGTGLSFWVSLTLFFSQWFTGPQFCQMRWLTFKQPATSSHIPPPSPRLLFLSPNNSRCTRLWLFHRVFPVFFFLFFLFFFKCETIFQIWESFIDWGHVLALSLSCFKEKALGRARARTHAQCEQLQWRLVLSLKSTACHRAKSRILCLLL